MDTKTISVSVPGKIHLIGEHAVVYNRPAIIATIDKRCFVSIESRNDKKIQIISKNYNIDLSISPEEIVENTENARNMWQKFLATKDVSLLVSITKDPLDYPILAIGETLKFYQNELENGFSLSIDSQIPVGAGCGSSSSLAVAIVSAITLFLKKSLDKEAIFKLAVKAEELKHGTPSGGDPATVLHGGMIWFQKISQDKKIIKPVETKIDEKIASNFYLVDTGKPEESTGEMIAIARKFIEENPQEAKEIFDEQESLTNEMLPALQNGDSVSLIQVMRSAEKNLEKLGVVSDFAVEVIRAIETSGAIAAAKISGGGGRTKGVGMLLVYHEDKEKLDLILKDYSLVPLQVRLGMEGLRTEI